MSRLVTLCTAQWADVEIHELADLLVKMGYDGVELASWLNGFDVVKCADDPSYAEEVLEIFESKGLKVTAMCSHIVGQCVGDAPDPRLNNFAPQEAANDPEKIRQWGIATMKKVAKAAKNLKVGVVTGFTGSPIWKYLYSFPQTTQAMIDQGFKEIYELWVPILEEFRKYGIKFAHEAHPAEIAFDYYTSQRLLETFKDWPEFGLNFDPSHLIWQGVQPDLFLKDFMAQGRVYHVHMKDAAVTLDGRSGLLGSHLDFGDLNRGWNFRSLGHGDIDFEAIIRILNDNNYQGPLSVEWEDSGMDRIPAATKACEYVRELDFEPSKIAFDAAIANRD